MNIHKLNLLTLLFLFFQTVGVSYAQETEAEVKAKAEKLFLDEQFVEATPLFLRLIALNPRSTDYNFKYGTCLLFNSYKKQDAFKYLTYSISDPNIDPQAYFYLGKAFHLNFQFNEAIKNYQLYLDKTAKPNPSFQVEHQIQMCQNGKRLLTTLSDLVVLEKKEIIQENFFRLYNLSNIGGTLLVTTDYQSKIDKKKKHVPLIHFPANARIVYYSSYGDSDNGNKDIFVRRKLPDGTWGLPQRVAGNVNTNFDEDYPYMAPGGEYLYFCSKGHNSMGGYDIFRSKYDAENNTFGPPENLDFAISSPDDDLFYVVDSLGQNAYFASSRQSQDGKIHVYKVRVDRVPIQLAIVKGSFASTVNPENKEIEIKVTDYASGQEIGLFKSNSKGSYLINFPKGGKYVYEMKVAGDNTVHKAVVSIPFLREFKPLKQKIQEEKEADGTLVKVTDLFNEEVEDAQAIIAEVIRSKAELNVNAESFDLKKLDEEKEGKKMLAALGLDKLSNQEIIMRFEAIESKQQERVTELMQMSDGSRVLMEQLADEVAQLQSEVKRTVSSLNNEPDLKVKSEKLLDAHEKVLAIEQKKQELAFLKSFDDSLSVLLPAEENKLTQLKDLTKQVQQTVINEQYEELKDAITAKSTLLHQVESDSVADPVERLLAQNEVLGRQKDKLLAQNKTYEQSEEQLKTELNALNERLNKAKEKDKPDLESKIAAKQQELDLVKEEKVKNEGKITTLSREQDQLTKEVTFMNSVQQTESGNVPGKTELDSKLAEIASNNNKSLESFVKQQVQQLDSNVVANRASSDLVAETKEQVEQLEKNYTLAQEAVAEQEQLTPEEKQALKIKNSEQLERKLDQELVKVEEAIARNPEDVALKEQQKQLETRKEQLVRERESWSEEPLATKTEVLTPENVLKELNPSYEAQKTKLNQLPEESGLTQLNELDNALLDQVNTQLETVYDDLIKDPLNKSLQERKEALNTLKKKTEEQISKREDRLEAIRETNASVLNEVTPENELKNLLPEYAEEVKRADQKTGTERLEALKEISEEALTLVKKELSMVQNSGKTDPLTQKRIGVLQELEGTLSEEVAAHQEALAVAGAIAVETDPVTTSGVENLSEQMVAELLPDYAANLKMIDASGKPESEILQEKIKVEQEALQTIRKEQEKIQKALTKTPDDSVLIRKEQVLEQLQAIHEEQVNTWQEEQLAQAKTELTQEQLEQELIPGYQPVNAEQIAVMTPKQLAETKKGQEDLSSAIDKELKAVDKRLAKTPTATLQARKSLLEKLRNEQLELAESVKGRETALAAAEAAEKVPDLQSRLGNDYDRTMNQRPASKEDAQEILSRIASTERIIQDQLTEEEQRNPSDKAKIEQLQAQKQALTKRRGVIEIELEALPNSEPAATTNPVTTSNPALLNSQLAKLEQEQMRLQDQKSTASKAEQKVIDKQLRENQEQQRALEQQKDTVQQVALQEQLDQHTKQLSAIDSDNPLKKSVETEVTSSGQQTAQATAEQLSLVQTVSDYLESETLTQKEEVLTSKGSLQEQRRRFVIEIGDLTEEVNRLESQKADPEKIQQKQALKAHLQEAVRHIDDQLESLQEEETLSGRGSEALQVPVDREKEQEIVSDPRYESLLKQQQEMNRNISKRNTDLNTLQVKREAFDQAETPVKKSALAAEIRQLTQGIEQTNEAITTGNQALSNALQEQGVKDPESWKNVLLREVQPQKNGSELVERLKPAVNNGFEIKQNPQDPGVQTVTKTIPVGVKAPSGLVYRVQVGAFAKPIPESLFAEFTPVTGEKLTNGITRYLAGYFGDRNKVVEAQRQIRQLGYSDAFVVAYCDGERITLAEARRMEDEGLCKPMKMDSIVMQVIENTLAQLPADTLAKYTMKPNPSDYNKAPDAAPAMAIEEIQSLFYTVQIGVYNRPASSTELRFVKPVVTRRLPNGQIRYATGTFRSVTEARPKKQEAVDKGITDAFITAYYQGERITLAEAERLLRTLGDTILFRETDLPKEEAKPVLVSNTSFRQTEEVRIEPVKYYELQSRDSFPVYPRKEISQLRVFGDFYYDARTGYIRSVRSVKVPVLVNQALTFDTIASVPEPETGLFEPNALEVVAIWELRNLNGLLADWLLRLNVAHELYVREGSMEIHLVCEDQQQQEALKEKCQRLGANVR